ncbi:MAG: biotin--protein ligase [Roseiflexaceae bacterium]|nr:biotin--protein ligase [Roseiflexaceae bacterium]
MHGEYKIPGGKLVVVDLALHNNRLHHVMLSGDFFLAPDEALEWMTAALEGLPADTPEALLTEHVQAATATAELLGITPAGVAIAIRRALSGGAA